MYSSFLSSELKKWLRDPLMKFMLFYPILFGIIGRYALPQIAESSGFSISNYADLIVVILALMTPLIFGALVAFSILDDRDDSIFQSIRVTPLSIHQFISFRLMMAFLLSLIATIYVMWFSNIGDFSFGNILAISFLASLAAPMTGLSINALAQNKIEGFAVMKGSGIVFLIFPVAALFFTDIKELLFSFVPGFWPAKAISALVRGNELLYLNYSQYILIGFIYVTVLNVLVYRFFLRRTRV